MAAFTLQAGSLTASKASFAGKKIRSQNVARPQVAITFVAIVHLDAAPTAHEPG